MPWSDEWVAAWHEQTGSYRVLEDELRSFRDLVQFEEQAEIVLQMNGNTTGESKRTF